MGSYLKKKTDVVVVGAGHAGCEAALACARLGLETVLFTVSTESIAMMPCNPNIGGSSKGHLVREVDALGGEMGINIDASFIQSKMLNRSKGPAVHSLRAQADKAEYGKRMRMTLEQQEHLSICQMEVTELITEEIDSSGESKTFAKGSMDPAGTLQQGNTDAANGNAAERKITERKMKGIRTYSGAVYECKACILCTGTYLRARCIYGDVSTYTGPNGLMAANHLTDSLKKLGITLYRFKTGTPARLDGNTIDYSRMEEQFGDETVVPFSFETDPADVQITQASCWLTYTNEKTHEIIRANLDRSPLFSGTIEGTGPRYCPSIEDKVVRFKDRNRHQVFLEPEGRSTTQMYVGGMSSSLPEDVQEAMYRTVPGLENARIVKNAYAIEYDCIDATQLKHTLEFKKIAGLFSAGQLNGSSGYEEAAAQGILAGINAVMYVNGKEPVIIDRSEGYIGVLADDLVTKENKEPYRMMTSRSEYRLLLRQDNADQRLTEKGYRVGLISEERYQKFLKKQDQIRDEIARVKKQMIGADRNVQQFLEENGSTPLKTSASLAELVRRPELNYTMLGPIDPERPDLPASVQEEVNIEIKYEGYIQRQKRQVEQFKKMETRRIPTSINYDMISSLRTEARQKLKQVLPASIGQASRISGVSPADIAVLLVYLENSNPAETGNSQENRNTAE